MHGYTLPLKRNKISFEQRDNSLILGKKFRFHILVTLGEVIGFLFVKHFKGSQFALGESLKITSRQAGIFSGIAIVAGPCVRRDRVGMMLSIAIAIGWNSALWERDISLLSRWSASLETFEIFQEDFKFLAQDPEKTQDYTMPRRAAQTGNIQR